MLLFLWFAQQPPEVFRRASGDYAYTRFDYIVHRAVIFGPNGPRWNFTSVPVLGDHVEEFASNEAVLRAVRSYLKSADPNEPVRRGSTILPERLNGGYYQVTFTQTLDREVVKKDSSQHASLTFDKFKERFGKEPPKDKKPPYLRTQKGMLASMPLELMAADCDLVVRGTIDDFCFARRIDDPTGDQSQRESPRGRDFQGNMRPEEITCYIPDARDLAELKRTKQELVLFLHGNQDWAEKYPEGLALEYRMRSQLWDGLRTIVLKSDSGETMFADLSWHRRAQRGLETGHAQITNPCHPPNPKRSPRSDCGRITPGLRRFILPAELTNNSDRGQSVCDRLSAGES